MNDILFKQLKSISADGIISYEYIHQIIEMINKDGKTYRDDLDDILKNNCREEEKPGLSHEVLFTAYYSLGFYYKRYDKLESLGNLINQYGHYFDSDILSKEVESWYYRRKGDLQKALKLDRDMMTNINIRVNAGPYISYASSVGKLLELEMKNNLYGTDLTYWSSREEMKKDWSKAISAIQEAMEQYQKIRNGRRYGKHYAIQGRLLMYTPDLAQKSLSEINNLLDKADESFRLAMQYENEREEDYYKRYEEYSHYQNKCNQLRMQLTINCRNKEMQDKIEELNLSKTQLQNMIEHNQAKEIELVTIFTAIISIIMGGAHISSSITLVEGELLLATLACVCLILICAAIALTFEENKRRTAIIFGIILCILLAGLIGVSFIYTI